MAEKKKEKAAEKKKAKREEKETGKKVRIWNLEMNLWMVV